ncbi:MAG TPA: cupin domain-containing protein [Acidobacteriaceae bacterium]|jgi:mannose-6-phosphate isomerase-like protein (cupin superfamily)|nr:cupin domain-containing protein [Acidobacteriaceae bacterium]
MHRRSFLKTAAAAVPALGFDGWIGADARTQVVASTAAVDVHVVGAGEDRFRQPHPMGFSSMLFKVPGQETGGNLFIVEHKNLMPGGPALHLHWNQEEWFYVMEGEVAFQVGEQRVTLHAGESVLAPRKVPHTFSAVGEKPGHMLIAFTPAGKMEAYFRDAKNPPAGVSPEEFFRRYEMDYIGPSPFAKS